MAKDLAMTHSAIAEARQIKEAAMAQAKLTIQETFQPTLQRMISSKLREEEEDEFDAVDIDIEVPDEEAPVDDVPEEGGEDIGMGSFEDDEEAPVEGEGDDLELEALIRELDGMEGGEEDSMMEMDDEFDPTMEEGEEESWQDPIEEEDCATDEDMLENLIREIMDGEEDPMLDESEDGGGAFEEKAPIKQMNHESRQLRAQNAKLRKDLNEALQAITTYKRTINEVNLLNAKLLYATKSLKTEGLTKPQQVRILESFDRATTVREVKLVYTTILESLNKKAKPAPRKVQEGLASKPIKAVNPKQNLNENENVIRWKQLAGLQSIKY
jgi:hypothetical protein